MSRELNTNGTMSQNFSSAIGKKEPLVHPQNCKKECPYGHGRAFCFPCMAKIMGESNICKKSDPLGA